MHSIHRVSADREGGLLPDKPVTLGSLHVCRLCVPDTCLKWLAAQRQRGQTSSAANVGRTASVISALINCQIRLLSGSSPHYGPVFFYCQVIYLQTSIVNACSQQSSNQRCRKEPFTPGIHAMQGYQGYVIVDLRIRRRGSVVASGDLSDRLEAC